MVYIRGVSIPITEGSVLRLVTEVNEKAEKHLSSKPYQYQSGAKILYRGRMIKLHVLGSKSGESKVSYKNGFYVQVPEELPPSDKHQNAKT